MNEQVIAQLRSEIEHREKGRMALLKSLSEIVTSKNHKAAIERAVKQLLAAGHPVPDIVKKTVNVEGETTQ